jgi:hypothetical protein
MQDQMEAQEQDYGQTGPVMELYPIGPNEAE